MILEIKGETGAPGFEPGDGRIRIHLFAFPAAKAATPRECRRFSRTWRSHRRDRTGWLGRQDSNLGMAESKSTCFAFDFRDHSEKSAKFDPFPINRLDADSECAGGPAEALWCVLITLAFAMIVFLTAWHGPDCRSPQRSISIGSAVLMAGCAQRRALMHRSA